jgi:hypothetical protein
MTDAPRYIGSIPPFLMQLAHPEIYARLVAGKPLTKAQSDELKACPFVIPYDDHESSDA